MKRKWLAAFFILLPSLSQAQRRNPEYYRHYQYEPEDRPETSFRWQGEFTSPVSGSFALKDSSGSFNVGVDFTENLKSVKMLLGQEEAMNRFAFGLLMQDIGKRSGTALRGKYTLELPIVQRKAGRLSSESSFAGGVLFGRYLRQGQEETQFEFNEVLYGGSQYLSAKWRIHGASVNVKAGGEWAGVNLYDDYGSWSQWDNYGFGLRNSVSVPLGRGVILSADGEALRKKYNPKLYFFVEKWVIEYGLRSELLIPLHRRMDLIPTFGYQKSDVERNRRIDLERPEYGTRIVFKDVFGSTGTNVFARGIYAPWIHRKGRETLASVGVTSQKFGVEVYRRDIREEYSTFRLEERIVGAKLSWRFGSKELKGIKDYGNVAKNKYKFYPETESAIKHHSGLSMSQQTEQLHSYRRRNEYSHQYLTWCQAPNGGWGFRFPNEVYSGGCGDCDEQAELNRFMDNRNGYHTIDGGWWDFNKSFIGHAVSLVKDRETGDWYWDEYGMTYKLDGISPNDNDQEVMRKAIQQNHRFSALPLEPGSNSVYYSLIDAQSGTYTWVTGFLPLGTVQYERKRPNLEYGSELWTGRNFLFDYR